MDLVLATLETKHDLNATKFQHPQYHPDRPGMPNQPWQDEGDGDGDQQQESSSPGRHLRGGSDLLDKKDFNVLVDKVSHNQESVRSGSSGGRLHPVSLSDDTGLLTRNHVQDKQLSPSAQNTSEEKCDGGNSSKRRLKRLLDSSSDED